MLSLQKKSKSVYPTLHTLKNRNGFWKSPEQLEQKKEEEKEEEEERRNTEKIFNSCEQF